MADVMKTTTTQPIRPSREAKLEARCSAELRGKLDRIAAIKECDFSDVLREAAKLYASKFEQQLSLA